MLRQTKIRATYDHTGQSFIQRTLHISVIEALPMKHWHYKLKACSVSDTCWCPAPTSAHVLTFDHFYFLKLLLLSVLCGCFIWHCMCLHNSCFIIKASSAKLTNFQNYLLNLKTSITLITFSRYNYSKRTIVVEWH